MTLSHRATALAGGASHKGSRGQEGRLVPDPMKHRAVVRLGGNGSLDPFIDQEMAKHDLVTRTGGRGQKGKRQGGRVEVSSGRGSGCFLVYF